MTEFNENGQEKAQGESSAENGGAPLPDSSQSSSPEPPPAWQQPGQAPNGTQGAYNPYGQQQLPNASHNQYDPYGQQQVPGNNANGQMIPPSQIPPQNSPQWPNARPPYAIPVSSSEAEQFQSARKFITASQIIALVSLLFGGMLLSTVAIVVAVIGYRKLDAIAQAKNLDSLSVRMLKRPGTIAIIMAVIALALNLASVVLLYPVVMEAVNSGDLSGLFGGGGATSGGGTESGSSLWG